MHLIYTAPLQAPYSLEADSLYVSSQGSLNLFKPCGAQQGSGDSVVNLVLVIVLANRLVSTAESTEGTLNRLLGAHVDMSLLLLA